MPYRRGTTSKKRRVTKKAVAQIARRVINRNVETKYKDFVLYGSTNVLSTAAPTLLSNTWGFSSACGVLSQGYTASQRIGEKVRIKRIELYFTVFPAVDAAMADGALCRFIVYHNKRANGAVPTGTDMFVIDAQHALRNSTKLGQLSILREYNHSLVMYSNNAGAAVSSGPAVQWKWTIYPKKTLQFQENNGSVADLFMDDYGVGYIGETNCCLARITGKLVFTDA